MKTVGHVMAVVLDILSLLLVATALAVVFMVAAFPVMGVGHGHWPVAGIATIAAIAMRTFVWLLPVVVVMFFVSVLVGGRHLGADQSRTR